MTKQRTSPPLALICHPYIFALKEGKAKTNNMLDYDLLLLMRNCSEVVRSPQLQEQMEQKRL